MLCWSRAHFFAKEPSLGLDGLHFREDFEGSAFVGIASVDYSVQAILLVQDVGIESFALKSSNHPVRIALLPEATTDDVVSKDDGTGNFYMDERTILGHLLDKRS